MKTHIKEHWRLLVGIILIALFFVVRIILVYAGGPHDVWTELISSLSFMIGIISGCLIVSDSKYSNKVKDHSDNFESEFKNILELQSDQGD